MTPAPISVERLRELIAEYWDLAYAEGAESRSHDTPAGDAMRVSAEIDKCIAALLHQLAELQAKTACTLGVGDGSGQLFVHGDYESIKAAQAVIAKLAEREAELSALRQACWDARAVLGFDNDGDPTPDALVYPSLADMVRRDAAEFRKGYDEACNEAHAAERAREGACGLLRESIGEIRDAATDARVANLPSRGAHLDKLAARIAAFLAASGGGGHVSPAGAPTAQQPLDESANNAGVATGSRNDSPSESVTRGSLPASDSICDALTAEWQAMGLYDATPASGGPRDD